MREGILSPTDSVISRHPPGLVDASRPVVRLPSAGLPSAIIHAPGINGHAPVPTANAQPAQMSQIPLPMMYGSHSTSIPMHQPRPQKAVSLADIESPTSFHFKAPPQQQEQPFHQQVPTHIVSSYTDDKAGAQPVQPTVPAMAGVTPLSQIPEGAAFAQGIQPYSVGGQAYYGAPYNNGAMFYPPMPDGGSFGLQMGGPAMAPSFIPGSQSHQVSYMSPAGAVGGGISGNMLAHESNGMVYYYNPSIYAPDAQGAMPQFQMTNGNLMPMANGMPAPAPFYHQPVPPAMFFPAQSG